MTFFLNNLDGFILDRYKDIPDEWRKVAHYRNLGWNVDLVAEHAEALKQFNLPIEGNGYNEVPSAYIEHDAAIQARIEFYQQGIKFGAGATAGAIDSLVLLLAASSGVDYMEKSITEMQSGLMGLVIGRSEALAVDEGMQAYMAAEIGKVMGAVIWDRCQYAMAEAKEGITRTGELEAEEVK